ncbi:hypothetical protein CRG98_000286 [Punica granatum]|uniref:Uncharacterized protein n=1 Tax=Punica granatum TaxID=22663 RepID=A0A2I0LF89_PUNGR|nr:hypothetical protein CRG98_000286 [Punica granatum]
MLEFCAKRNIAADIELIWMDQVNGGHGEVRQPPRICATASSQWARTPPSPSSLFTLDFTTPSAHQYFLALLRHVSPLGLTSVDLHGLASPIGPDEARPIPTLMPNHSLQARMTSDSVMSVNGVRISSLDMDLGMTSLRLADWAITVAD